METTANMVGKIGRKQIEAVALKKGVTHLPRNAYPILSGPSHYEYSTSHSLRKHDYWVEFTIYTERGEETIKTIIFASMQEAEQQNNFCWRFQGNNPTIKTRGSDLGSAPYAIIGNYSTVQRTGWIKAVTRNFSLLLNVAFGEEYFLDELRSRGYKIPDHEGILWEKVIDHT